MTLVRTLVTSTRPLSWVNTAFPFAAAYLVGGGSLDTRFVVGTLFFLVPYNALMYGINDVFDYESDLRNPRKGGVEGAVLRPQFHRPVLWTGIVGATPFLVYLGLVGTVAANAVLALAVGAVLAYSVKGLRFKEIPFLDSITSSTHFVGPALYGLVLAANTVSAPQWVALGAFFLWGVASHAFGAVQDIVADREGGLSSIATVMGGAWTVRFAVACYLLAGVAVLALSGPALWVAPVSLIYVAAVVEWWNVSDDHAGDAHRGWRRFLTLNFVAGAVVTLALLNATS